MVLSAFVGWIGREGLFNKGVRHTCASCELRHAENAAGQHMREFASKQKELRSRRRCSKAVVGPAILTAVSAGAWRSLLPAEPWSRDLARFGPPRG